MLKGTIFPRNYEVYISYIMHLLLNNLNMSIKFIHKLKREKQNCYILSLCTYNFY